MALPSQAKKKPTSEGVSLSKSLFKKKELQGKHDDGTSGLLNGKQHQQQLNRFLSKTFHMVNDNTDADVVSWNATGDSFVIKNIDEFSKTTLPLYFNHSKYSSFVRQLNFYGFSKIRVESPLKTEDDEKHHTVCFYHEYFRKDRPDLLHKIYRVTRKSKGDYDPISDGQKVQQLQREVAALHNEMRVLQKHMESKLVEVKQSMQQEYEKRISNLEQTCMGWIVLLQSSSIASSSSSSQVPSSSPTYPHHHHPFLGGLPSSCLSSSSFSSASTISPSMVGVPRSFWPAELSTRRGSWGEANGSTSTTIGPASPLHHDNAPHQSSSLSTTTALLLSAKEIINASDAFMMPSSGFIR